MKISRYSIADEAYNDFYGQKEKYTNAPRGFPIPKMNILHLDTHTSDNLKDKD